MLKHGGRLREAAARYGIPIEAWLDLSTGINPDALSGAPIAAFGMVALARRRGRP